MNILIIGGGGREHALAWKLKQSDKCENLYIAPGNAGTAKLGTNVPIAVTDFAGLVACCAENEIDMVMVGPEEPLVKGIYDYFKNDPLTSNLALIGPSKEASQLEGSKSYAKAFMQRHGIPTAAYREFEADNFEEGIEYIKQHSLPIVLKADGLAAGKGVIICTYHIEALAEFELMVQQAKFGDAGRRVVIEQFLDGIELSMFVLTDGKNYVMLPDAKDYKRIGVGNTGPNTGGMGAVSPVPFVDDAYMEKVKKAIIDPTIEGLVADKLEYKGIIFVGLINVDGEPFVIEYNCRLGDPETEAILPRIDNDLVELLMATAEQRLDEITVHTNPQNAVTIVAVSGGYPNEYQNGKQIYILDEALTENTFIFHSGTKEKENKVVTNGGRVLAITSLGNDIGEAADRSAAMLENIFFEGINFRNDIGFEFR